MKYWAAWIIINDKKQILLLKRSDYNRSFSHHWTIPWWRWKQSETPEQIAVREVKEEIWLDFNPTILFQTWILNHPEWAIKKHLFLWNYSWEIKASPTETEWYGWFHYDEARILPIAFDYLEVIELLHKKDHI